MFNLPFFKSKIPRPDSNHLVSLSTPHGIMQHTMYNLPDPTHGYSSDDNSRALIAAHLWKIENPENSPLMATLESAYLRFLKFAQHEDGQFYCFVTFDLQKKELGTGDWFGRSLHALSYLGLESKKFSEVSSKLVFKSLPLLFRKEFSLRTTAFLTLATYYFLKSNERERLIRKKELDKFYASLKRWRVNLKKRADVNFSKGWLWPENKITYDNGKVIQSYLLLGVLLEDQTFVKLGQDILDFYIDQTFKKGYFQAPGNRGFWEKGIPRPLYDEQSLEAYSMTAALISAQKILHNNNYKKLAEDSYLWFWGKNRLNKTLIDKSGAVYDGLRRDDINTNQGAESYLSLCLAYFALTKKIHL